MFLCNSWTERRKRRRLKLAQWKQNSAKDLSVSLPTLDGHHQHEGRQNGADQFGHNGVTRSQDIESLVPEAECTNAVVTPSLDSPSATEATAFLMQVHLKQGWNLLAMDSTGTSDPYVKFKYMNSLIYKSETINQNLNPRWDEKFEHVIDNRSIPLQIEVYDFDRFTADDFMGQATVDLASLPLDSEKDLHVPLIDKETGQEAGHLCLAISFKPMSRTEIARMKEHGSSVFKTSMSSKRLSERTSVIHVVLVEAKDLHPVMLSRSAPKPDPYVRMRLGDERVKSRTASKTLDPKWVQAFVFHPRSPTECLEVMVFDKKKDALMGKCKIDVNSLEPEKTHHEWYDLEGNAGEILIAITVTGLVQGDVSDLASYETNPVDTDALDQKYSVKNTLGNKSVGFLVLKVFKADGLAALDIAGKSDPFCVVELVNSRLQTNTIYKSLSPEWNKVFTLNVDDVNAVLELTVYDEDQKKKMEFMGKVAIPLLNIRNGQTRWYALKDQQLLKRVKGRICIEATLFWNPVHAALRTFKPKEMKYTAQKGRFRRRVFMRNVDRVKKYASSMTKVQQFVQSCFTWKSPPRSFAAFLMFVLVVYFFELYMVPMALAITLFMAYVTISLAHDDDDLCGDEGYIHSDSEHDDEEEEAGPKTPTGITGTLDTVQNALMDIQTSLEFAVSTTERVQNLFNFTSPFCSYLAIAGLAAGVVLLYFVSIRWLLLAWGINKFTKKFRVPRGHVPNNELLDFLSRVPCDKEIKMYGERCLKHVTISESDPENM